MGRLKRQLELTPEETLKLIERRRESSKKYYWKNKERIDQRQKEKYYELRKDI
jgi:hypothetical protein